MSSQSYDIFISYAREDSPWVRTQLYEPLRRCRTADGRRPRIFFDVGEEGIGIGENFLTAITNAIRASRKIVVVYSKTYFRKPMTMFELTKASQTDPTGSGGLLNPILMEPDAAPEVPFEVNHINYRSCCSSDWFAQLCRSLGLEHSNESLTLEFLDQPGDVFVRHTLPRIRVALRLAGGRQTAVEEPVTMSIESGDLQGTITVETRGGIASFQDLSVGSPAFGTRLIARSEGIDPVFSQPFSIHLPAPFPPVLGSAPAAATQSELPPARRAAEAGPTISMDGEVIFFGGGKALAVVSGDKVAIFDDEARPLLADGPIRLGDRVRLCRRAGDLLALADWSGEVHLFARDGRHARWSFRQGSDRFAVPAEVEFVGESAFVGFWSGVVSRLEIGHEPVKVLRHDAGVQDFAVVGDCIFIGDFEGSLRLYRDGRVVNANTLEPSLWFLKAYPGGVVALGDRKLYHIALRGSVVRDFPLPLDGIASVYDDVEVPVLLSPQGQGVRIDGDLVRKVRFHTTPDAVPTSADDAGRYCVLSHPDRSRTLLVRDQIVYSRKEGALAVSPRGDRFAVGDGFSIRILDAAAFDALRKEEAEGG